MPHPWEHDDHLLAELGKAVRDGQQMPAGFVELGKAAFAWRIIDADIAAICHDSATSTPAPITRTEPAALRTMTFTASHLTIEVELTPDALLGQLIPPQPGEVELHDQHGTVHVAQIHETGWFRIRLRLDRLFRLHVRPMDGDPVITAWIDPRCA